MCLAELVVFMSSAWKMAELVVFMSSAWKMAELVVFMSSAWKKLGHWVLTVKSMAMTKRSCMPPRM